MGESDITEAEDGAQGFNVIEQNGSFDLILLDWNMTNMDGITMLIQVREKCLYPGYYGHY